MILLYLTLSAIVMVFSFLKNVCYRVLNIKPEEAKYVKLDKK